MPREGFARKGANGAKGNAESANGVGTNDPGTNAGRNDVEPGLSCFSVRALPHLAFASVPAGRVRSQLVEAQFTAPARRDIVR